MTLSSDIYFEKQGTFSNQCGKCALNNLVGQHKFTSQLLVNICHQQKYKGNANLKHFIGGDYDIIVLISALKLFDIQCKWLLDQDKTQIIKHSQLKQPSRLGYLINQPAKSNMFKNLLGLSDRHWIAVRLFNNHYYLLDSKSQQKYPEHIIKIDKFLQAEITKGSYLFQIINMK